MTQEHQQWDIVTSVGLTALAVSAARAIETESEDRLVEDRYAAKFVRAANPPQPMPTTLAEANGDPLWTAMAASMGVRSRFFDEVLTTTTVDQVVILASGLDARAYRLDLRASDVYEVDQPQVLAFKQEVLDNLGAQPSCRRHTVPADLRDDWTTTLTDHGFDPARPTAWLVEGLLPYLPAKAEEELFELVHDLSAPGSRLGVEQMADRDLPKLIQGTAFQHAADRFGLELDGLMNNEPRRIPSDWLRDNGWQVKVEPADETSVRYGRQLSDALANPFRTAEYVLADLPR